MNNIEIYMKKKKIKKHQYCCKQFKSLSEGEKQELNELVVLKKYSDPGVLEKKSLA